YIHWGEAVLDKLNGMFAFAVWDSVRKKLFLARDRYGIKPLYYYDSPSHFLFASEIKSIIVHPNVNVSVDQNGLLEYMTFQNFFTDRTLFNNIHLLPPATWIRYSYQGDQWLKESSQYWDYNFCDSNMDASETEIEEELDRLFRQAVKRQLISDVDVGAYLSGGMDSGSITAIAAQEFPYIRSFTCGFDLRSASGIEISFDERSTAEYMSYLFKTMHYEVVIKSGDMERIMNQLMWHIEEPRVGQCYPNYYISQLASKFVKVVLAGTGGDELFGGYPWRYYRAVNNSSFDDYTEKYYAFWQRLIPLDSYEEFFKPIQSNLDLGQARDIFKGVFKQDNLPIERAENYINHSLYFEAKTFLHGLFLIEDKISMSHGLETRVPFMDNDLVDFAMRIP
ncbi:asparagine synthase (glutamine-hydrolyzing), partial [bacterium]|nr:asparagine synthase (glutamine-hydrolyzing) [bacterium]